MEKTILKTYVCVYLNHFAVKQKVNNIVNQCKINKINESIRKQTSQLKTGEKIWRDTSLKKICMDFPGGLVAKTLGSQWRGLGSILGQETRSRMLY